MSLLIFLIVLGVLIFVHELGHFLAAKACGVYCDRFSLGMPPRIWGIKIGETDYCIGALPIGGYVKMAGQEDAPLSDEERNREYAHVPPHRWFSNRPAWQRTIVIFAGPFMNLLFGIILYAVMAASGSYVPESRLDNRIGEVEPESPAAAAPLYAIKDEKVPIDFSAPPDGVGWQTGDRIVAINGHKIVSVAVDVQADAVLGKGDTLNVEIERTAPDGAVARYLSPVSPEVPQGERYARLGVSPFDTALIGIVVSGSPAANSGLQQGDIVVRADGRTVDRNVFREMVSGMEQGQSLTLELERSGQPLSVTLTPETVGSFEGIQFEPAPFGDEEAAADLPVTVVSATDDARRATGLQRKDVVEQINGGPATAAVLYDLERNHPGEPVTVRVHRPAILYGLIQKEEVKELRLEIIPIRAIGVVFEQRFVRYRVPALRVVPEAFRLAYQAFARVLQTLQELVTGGVSVRDLGGVITIGRVVNAAYKSGLSILLETTAFISVNLCVVNLLPLPVLDGSLLLFIGLETIRRKPLGRKVLERIQQVGLVFLVVLMIFLLSNDIALWVKDLKP